MIGLDTNVLVRYLVRDDDDQSARARAVMHGLIEAEPGFISLVTMVELHWVLRRAYKLTSDHCVTIVDSLLGARDLRVGQDVIMRSAQQAAPAGADFADAVIHELGRTAGCDYTLTFEARGAETARMRLIGDPSAS